MGTSDFPGWGVDPPRSTAVFLGGGRPDPQKGKAGESQTSQEEGLRGRAGYQVAWVGHGGGAPRWQALSDIPPGSRYLANGFNRRLRLFRAGGITPPRCCRPESTVSRIRHGRWSFRTRRATPSGAHKKPTEEPATQAKPPEINRGPYT